MLIEKKTHCSKCNGSMTHGVYMERAYICSIYRLTYSAYLCDNPDCDRAIGTIIDVNGRQGFIKSDIDLFNQGTLGNTFALSKEELQYDFIKR